jgi:hypothetical protein
MKDEKIKKYIEPLLHLFPIAAALSFAIPPLILNMYNPSLEEAWCNVQAFPSYCVSWRSVDIECTRGRDVNGLAGTVVAMAFGLGVIIVCLLLVVCKVCIAERQIVQRVNHIMSHLSHDAVNVSFKWQQHTIVVLVQAIAYVVAFSLSLVFIFIQLVGDGMVGLDWETVIKLQLFFQP